MSIHEWRTLIDDEINSGPGIFKGTISVSIRKGNVATMRKYMQIDIRLIPFYEQGFVKYFP